MDELAAWLAHERRLLEMLLFKLIEERHLLAAGESRFLGLAAAEVRQATVRLEEAQLRRSVMVSELGDDVTLGQLAGVSREPFRTIFEELHQSFLDLVAEIDEVSDHNGRQAEIGARLADLDQQDVELGLADAGYQVVLDSPLAMPALRDFLG
jgi:hypothetical protein